MGYLKAFFLCFRLQKWGLNTYLYAPKDDYKHRMFWREMYSVEEAGNCLYFSSVLSISRFLNELVIAMYTCVCLITVAIPKGDWKALFNTLQVCLWELWNEHGFTSFNCNCRWFPKLLLRLCLTGFIFCHGKGCLDLLLWLLNVIWTFFEVEIICFRKRKKDWWANSMSFYVIH